MKTRLVGAAILIALAVIFVPMLLPGSSGSRTPDMDVPPPPSGEMQTRILEVGPDRARSGTTVAAAIINDRDQVATVDLSRPSGASAGGTAVPASAAPATAASANATVARRGATPESPPEAAEPEASAPLPGGAGVASAVTYAVNLGIYADHGSAKKLVADARKYGFTAATAPETFQGKSVLRVRVGPFDSEAAAQAARLKLKDFAHVPMTVEATSVDQSGDAPSSALPANQPGAWAVQLAAFSDQAAADKLRDRLRTAGFDGYVDGVDTSKGRLWRVRAGPFANRRLAETTRGRIEAQLKIKGNLVTEK